MKQVINKTVESNVIHVSDLVNPGLRSYVAVNGDKSVRLLMHESNGYIFRNVANHTYGHSGHHGTMTKAISEELEVGDTKVFEFPNLIQAAQFILEN